MARGPAPGRGGLSRAMGAAALPLAALYVARHLAGLAAGLLPPAGGEAAAAAILALAAAWGAPALARRLGARPREIAPPRAPAVFRGLLGGAAAAAALAALLAATGGVRWAPGLRASPALAAATLLAASLAYGQEAFARGAALGVLEARTGPRTALWGSAGLAALTVWLWGGGAVGAAVIFALGLWWGRGRLRSGSAAGAEAAHAAWAVALGPLLGIGGDGLGSRLAPVRPSLLAAHLGSILWAGAPGPSQGGLAALLVAGAAAALSAVPIIRRPAS